MTYLYLACAFTLNALANILLKVGARSGLDISSYHPIYFVGANWQLLLGGLLFALNAFFYFLALRTLPISVAYPVMVVMSFVLINAYALTVLGESITPLQVVGYMAIVLGLFLVVVNA